MNRRARLLCTLFFAACPLFAQASDPAPDPVAQPRQLTYCELSKDPAAFNHADFGGGLFRLTSQDSGEFGAFCFGD